MKTTTVGVALGLLIVTTAHATADSVPDPRCATGPLTVAFVDDRIDTAAWREDLLRPYRLPSFAAVARPAAAKFCVLNVLDADPYFAPGRGPEPWLLLRGRISNIKPADRSLADKADTAVRRYIESYIGAPEVQHAVVDWIEVSVDAVCVADRKSVRTVVASTRRDSSHPDNAAVYAAAVEELLAMLVKDAPTLATACAMRGGSMRGPDAAK